MEKRMNEMKEFQEREVQIAQQVRDDGLAPRRESKPSAVNNQKRGGQAAFTKPSRGMSEAKGEQESTETLSFRCDCERCRLTRGAVDIFKTKAAFTLAEVLITLGIIGVVAALTLPSLIAKYQEKVLVNQAKKNYALVTNAINQYNMDIGANGNDYSMFMDAAKGTQTVAEEFAKYFKGAKLCFENGKATCDLSYKVKTATPVADGYGNYKIDSFYKFSGRGLGYMQLIDGSFLGLIVESKNAGECGFKYNQPTKDENGVFIKNPDGSIYVEEKFSSRCGRIIVDTNGKKGPNRYGSDVFVYQIFANKISFYDEEGSMLYILKENKIQPYINYNEGKFEK